MSYKVPKIDCFLNYSDFKNNFICTVYQYPNKIIFSDPLDFPYIAYNLNKQTGGKIWGSINTNSDYIIYNKDINKNDIINISFSFKTSFFNKFKFNCKNSKGFIDVLCITDINEKILIKQLPISIDYYNNELFVFKFNDINPLSNIKTIFLGQNILHNFFITVSLNN